MVTETIACLECAGVLRGLVLFHWLGAIRFGALKGEAVCPATAGGKLSVLVMYQLTGLPIAQLQHPFDDLEFSYYPQLSSIEDPAASL